LERDFTKVYDDNVWRVYGFLAYRLRSRADAEDLTQQTFERALGAWDRFDERKAQAGTWLIAIARNLLVDHYRSDRSARHQTIGADGLPEEALPVEGIPDASLGLEPELERALGQLSARDREVLALRFGGELTGPEIAALLDLSLANVQQILSRSLRRLRALLEEGGYAAKGPAPATPSAATARSIRPEPK
jgi:RNA polymerase sigma factor (sigma-70 family)